MATVQKITPCLWFDMNADEAMEHYVSTFNNSRIVRIQRYPAEVFEAVQPGMVGKVLQGELADNSRADGRAARQ